MIPTCFCPDQEIIKCPGRTSWGSWLPIHFATLPVQLLFTSTPMSMVTVCRPGLKVFGDLNHGRILVSSVFFLPILFQTLVVDLGDSTFAPPTLYQLVDRALTVTLELVQVLVEDFTRTQCWYQIVKLPSDLLWGTTLLGSPFSLPLLLELENGDRKLGSKDGNSWD